MTKVAERRGMDLTVNVRTDANAIRVFPAKTELLPDIPVHSIHDRSWVWILYKFTQKILLVGTYIFIHVFTRFSIEGKENLKNINKGPVLIVANHKSYYDPPMIGLAFPFFSKIYPFRFMIWDGFFIKLKTRLLFKLMGCYPAYRKQGIEKSLAAPIYLLNHGETVIYFPEGKCIRQDELGEPKRGIGMLVSEFPNIPIVPIAIKGTHKISSNIFRRPKVKMKIGEPFTLKLNVMRSPDQTAEMVMEEIAKLYV
ncbi:MAG TPA: lysophospholipid acyltransferase family protein [Patescibacteria group bacterium]